MVFSEDEAEIILKDAAALSDAGADGLVFGALNMDGTIDQNLNKQFIQVCIQKGNFTVTCLTKDLFFKSVEFPYN